MKIVTNRNLFAGKDSSGKRIVCIKGKSTDVPNDVAKSLIASGDAKGPKEEKKD